MKKFLKFIWQQLTGLPKDKLLHKVFACIITLWVFAPAYYFTKDFRNALFISNGAALLALILKEVFDLLHKDSHTAEFADVGYGIRGIFLADVPIVFLFVTDIFV